MFARHEKPLRFAAVIGLYFVTLELAGCCTCPTPGADGGTTVALAAGGGEDDGGPITILGRARFDKNSAVANNVHFDIQVVEGGTAPFQGSTFEVWWASRANEADPIVWQPVPGNPIVHPASDQYTIEDFEARYNKYFLVRVRVSDSLGTPHSYTYRKLTPVETFAETFDQPWYPITEPAP